jgi:hypothetical protein
VLCALACQSRPNPPAPTASVSVAPVTSSANTVLADGRLPEDPVAGARAVAQWRAHLLEEERERKAQYDQRRLEAHQAVVSFLRSAKTSYDSANTAAAVEQLRRQLAPQVTATRRRVDKIDHWGRSSNVFADYQQLLDTFSEPYASARLAAIHGEPGEFQKLKTDADARLQKIADWLAFVGRSEPERD